MWQTFKDFVSEYFWEIILFIVAVINFVVFLGADGFPAVYALVTYFGMLLILGQCLIARDIRSIRAQAATRPITVFVTEEQWDEDFVALRKAKRVQKQQETT